MINLWLPLLGFVAVAASVFGLAILLVGGRNRAENEILTGYGRRHLLFGALTWGLSGILPASRGVRNRLTTFLRHAGFYHRLALSEFLALRNMLVVGWALLTVATVVAVTPPGGPWPIPLMVVGALVALVLFSVPRLALEVMAKARVRRIEEGLPDALDMVTMCMSGGLSLNYAMLKVCDQLQATHPDLTFELRVVGRQMEAGTLESAVRQFAERVDAPEIHSLAAMIWQTQEQGTGAASAFLTFADHVRLHRRQRAEEAGNKTAVKMLFPIVFCLAPPVYLMLLSPAVLELADFIKRESRPGGAISATRDNMRDLLPEDLGGTLDEAEVASKAAASAHVVAPSEPTAARPGPARRPAKLPPGMDWP